MKRLERRSVSSATAQADSAVASIVVISGGAPMVAVAVRRRRSSVSVSDGVVHHAGQVNSQEQKAPARVAAEYIVGVRAVEGSRALAMPSVGYTTGAYL